ncbi:MAG: hypothetical protein QM704_14820 [Anaeromyxobacteraceae bacterium]
MSRWNHAICWDCWEPVMSAAGYPNRDPVRVIDSEPVPCCWCGTETDAGIFLRKTPEDPGLACAFSTFHEDE